MRKTSVESDDLACPTQHRSGLGNGQERRHHTATACGDAFGALALGIAAPHQHRCQPGRLQALANSNPAVLGPELVGPAGAGDQHRAERRCCPAAIRRGDAEIGRAVRHRIAQMSSGQAPVALDRLQLARHRGAATVEQGCRRLADAGKAVAQQRPLRLQTPQDALEQALQVEHPVVALAPQFTAQRSHGGARIGGKQGLAPLAPGQGQHALHASVQARNRGERRLDQPIHLQAGLRTKHVADRRQRVDHVTHRRGLDDQDAHGKAFRTWRWLQRPAPG